MLYRTLRDTKFTIPLALALILGQHPALAQDATWDGLINAGRAALQQDNFSDAEGHFEQALETAEKFSPGDPRLGRSLNNLAAVYYKQKDYDRAEPLMRRSLAVLEESLGPKNADVAQTKKNLAAIYYLQGNYGDAEPLLKESLAILEELHGPNHAFVATVLNNLAALYQSQNRYGDAEPLLSRSLRIWETLLGKDHRDVVKSRELLARLRDANGQTSGRSEPQQTAETEVNPQAPSLEATAAEQILALASEAEAAIANEADVGDVDANDAAAVPNIDRENPDVERATRALANLSASESAAAANGSENALPTPTVRTAALSASEGENRGVAPDPPNFVVYLSTLWSEDEAKRYWQALKEELPDVLADKKMEIEEVASADDGGLFYRVLTSPFPSDPAAQEACDEIKSQVRTHDCNVIAR